MLYSQFRRDCCDFVDAIHELVSQELCQANPAQRAQKTCQAIFQYARHFRRLFYIFHAQLSSHDTYTHVLLVLSSILILILQVNLSFEASFESTNQNTLLHSSNTENIPESVLHFRLIPRTFSEDSLDSFGLLSQIFHVRFFECH